jgi:hypothetical protein
MVTVHGSAVPQLCKLAPGGSDRYFIILVFLSANIG